MIDAGVAPMAFRMPISRVRSATAIIMMLETPIAPANRVITPTTQVRARMPKNRLWKRLKLLSRLKPLIARSSSGATRCRTFSMALISFSTSTDGRVRSSRIGMLVMRSPMPSRRASAGRGTKMRLLNMSSCWPPAPKPVVSQTPTTWKVPLPARMLWPIGSSLGANSTSRILVPMTATLRASLMSQAFRKRPWLTTLRSVSAPSG